MHKHMHKHRLKNKHKKMHTHTHKQTYTHVCTTVHSKWWGRCFTVRKIQISKIQIGKCFPPHSTKFAQWEFARVHYLCVVRAADTRLLSSLCDWGDVGRFWSRWGNSQAFVDRTNNRPKTRQKEKSESWQTCLIPRIESGNGTGISVICGVVSLIHIII